MANRNPIKTIAYVHTKAGLVCTDDLNEEQRKRLATELKLTYLNNMFSGEATFTVAEQEKDKVI